MHSGGPGTEPNGGPVGALFPSQSIGVPAVANTLTNLIPEFTEALDVISREMVGMIPAVRRDSALERMAIGQTCYIPVTPEASSANNTAAVTAPDTGDQTIANTTIAITKSKHVPVRFNGEETRGLSNAGTFGSIRSQRMYQGMRTLVNEIEADLWAAAYVKASRAYGTAGTTPFGTAADMTDFAGVARILDENGAPVSDRQLVLGHAAIGNLRGKQSGLFKVNEAGSADMLRNGMTDRIQNFAIRHSDAVTTHTKGAMTGFDINNGSGEAVGQTSLTFDGGTVNTTGAVAGDVVTLAGDTNKYVVNTTTTSTSGELVINKPGLLVAAADATEITIGNSYTGNLAFDRNAVVLVSRMPAMPEGGDSAEDVITLVDDRTGLAFEVALYKQFLQNVFHVRLAWGVAAIKQEHIALLLG